MPRGAARRGARQSRTVSDDNSGSGYVEPASTSATRTTSPTGSPPTGPTAGRSSRTATGSSPPAPARGRTGRSSCAGCSASSRSISMGLCGPTHDERSWTFDLDPGGRDPVLGYERLQEAFLARFPDYDRGITVPAIVDVPTKAGRHQRLRADHPRPLHRVDGAPPRRRARPVPGEAARRDGRRHAARLHRGQQRGVPVRVRRLAGGVRQGLRPAVHRAGLAGGAAGRPAVPDGRDDHRGRRPAVHDAGPLRRRLPRPLQVQPAEADRVPGAVGATRATCSRRRASATRSTSRRSRSTTTSSTRTSIRRRSSPPARTPRTG